MKKSLHASLLLLILSLSCTKIFAEGNCPNGYYPVGGGNGGWQGCAPMSSGSSSYSPPNPGPQWATRWGAMAYDQKSGGLGGVDGLASKRKAQKAAIAECEQNGGKSCKVISSYYNQCGAMAWGNKRYIVSRGPELTDIQSRALGKCNELAGQCEIFYSGCSYPEQIR